MVFIINLTQPRITWEKCLWEFSILGRPAVGLDEGLPGKSANVGLSYLRLSYWPICGGLSRSP